MAVDHYRRLEFLRKVYRGASADTEAARETYINGLADVALAAANSGKALSGSSGNGLAANYQFFNGWNPDDVLRCCAWARDFISKSTAALAVAEVKPRVTTYQTATTGVFL